MRLYSPISKKTWYSLFLREFVIVLDIIKNSVYNAKARSISQDARFVLLGTLIDSLIGGILITHDVCSSLRT